MTSSFVLVVAQVFDALMPSGSLGTAVYFVLVVGALCSMDSAGDMVSPEPTAQPSSDTHHVKNKRDETSVPHAEITDSPNIGDPMEETPWPLTLGRRDGSDSSDSLGTTVIAVIVVGSLSAFACAICMWRPWGNAIFPWSPKVA
jgi:hypothetical protein